MGPTLSLAVHSMAVWFAGRASLPAFLYDRVRAPNHSAVRVSDHLP